MLGAPDLHLSRPETQFVDLPRSTRLAESLDQVDLPLDPGREDRAHHLG